MILGLGFFFTNFLLSNHYKYLIKIEMITGSVNCMVIGIGGKVYLKEATCIELRFFEMRGIR